MPHLDPARWHRLSTLLDQALDLDPGGRAALLASLRETSPDVAESLHDFLAELEQVAENRLALQLDAALTGGKRVLHAALVVSVRVALRLVGQPSPR